MEMERLTGSKGIFIDPMYADFLRSTSPSPTQESIDRVLRKMTCVRVLGGGMIDDKALEAPLLLECTDVTSLEKLRLALVVQENPHPLNHCMCCGAPTLEIYQEEQLIATLGIHHGKSIRWSVWKQDANLQDGFILMQWLEEHGIPGPMRAFQKDRADREKLEKDTQAWIAAMPLCLKPFYPAIRHCSKENLPIYLHALEETNTPILSLFAWFGSILVPWNQYRGYELVPETILLAFPTDLLIQELESRPLTFEELEGAGRFFTGWNIDLQKPTDAKKLTAALKKALWEHVLSVGNPANIKRAEPIFL